MKNLKQYQGQIWRSKSLEDQFSRIANKLDESRDETTSFFSGMLSSFLSTIFTMALVLTKWIANPWIPILSGLVAFVVLWIFIKSVIIPFFSKRRLKRKKIQLGDNQKDTVVSHFNSYIVYSALEMGDSLNTINQTTDIECKNMNIVLIVQEWSRCIQYICNNILRDKHIRDTKSNSAAVHLNHFINIYVFNTTINLLKNIGDGLITCITQITDVESNSLLKADLENSSLQLNKYINTNFTK